MAIEYHINERDDLITVTVTGPVTTSEACDRINDLLDDVDFNADLPQLIDLRTAELTGPKDELERFERFLLSEYRAVLNASVAIVVNPDWDEETCAQAFWMCCSLYRAELFDGWNQACKWLIKKEFTNSLADLDVIVEASSDFDEASGDLSEASGDSAKSGASDHHAKDRQ